MGKRLILIRHAKSSWDEPLLSDHQRELADRGIKDCALMAYSCQSQLAEPDKFYCSTATRAVDTLSLILAEKALGDTVSIEYSDAFYTFNSNELVNQISELDEQYQCVGIVGHNPAITDLVNQLTRSTISNVPTGALVVIDFTQSLWRNISTKTEDAVLSYFATPKQLKSRKI